MVKKGFVKKLNLNEGIQREKIISPAHDHWLDSFQVTDAHSSSFPLLTSCVTSHYHLMLKEEQKDKATSTLC